MCLLLGNSLMNFIIITNVINIIIFFFLIQGLVI